MPVTTGAYANNEILVYQKLIAAGLNNSAACGILANISSESGFNSKNLQNAYESSLNYNDDSYTSAVDNGSYTKTKFVNDKAGYGLAQWTYSARKQGLYEYAKSRNVSIGNLDMQVEYLLKELQSSSFSGLWNTLKTVPDSSDGAYTAAYEFCRVYERPAGGLATAAVRGSTARTYRSQYVDNPGIVTAQLPVDYGKSIVEIAKQYLIDGFYIKKEPMFDSTIVAKDEASFIYYCYTVAGVAIPNFDMQTTGSSLNSLERNNKIKSITDSSNISPGDIRIDYASSGDYRHYGKAARVSISVGDGNYIYAEYDRDYVINADDWYCINGHTYTRSQFNMNGWYCLDNDCNANNDNDDLHAIRKVEDWLKESNPRYRRDYGVYGAYHITQSKLPDPDSLTRVYRIVSDNQTTSSGGAPYTYVQIADPYESYIADNLSRVASTGFDYGYLIDMTHGEEFKFYIPDFTETAGANWSDIEIRGRSVTVKSYESTNSRSISISLELYAGVGLYKAKTNETKLENVSRLHRDANFVKSLEYPDYTTAITQPPPTVHLILGAALNIAGVVSDVSVEHLKPLDELNRAMYIKLSFKVTQTAVNPPDYRDIRYAPVSIADTADIESLNEGGTTIEGVPTNAPAYTKEG